MKADLFEKILDRTETKIINKVYCWHQASSDPEDECQSIEQDLKAISLNITEENVKNVYNFDYKKLVKTIARNAAFIQLEFLKESHRKVEQNQYDGLFSPQGSVTSGTITNTQCHILF